jgi:hypothetical protein
VVCENPIQCPRFCDSSIRCRPCCDRPDYPCSWLRIPTCTRPFLFFRNTWCPSSDTPSNPYLPKLCPRLRRPQRSCPLPWRFSWSWIQMRFSRSWVRRRFLKPRGLPLIWPCWNWTLQAAACRSIYPVSWRLGFVHTRFHKSGGGLRPRTGAMFSWESFSLSTAGYQDRTTERQNDRTTGQAISTRLKNATTGDDSSKRFRTRQLGKTSEHAHQHLTAGHDTVTAVQDTTSETACLSACLILVGPNRCSPEPVRLALACPQSAEGNGPIPRKLLPTLFRPAAPPGRSRPVQWRL